MAYKNYYDNVQDETKELAYDLRQGYAKLLTNILGDIELAMQERDYKKWFEGEDRLFMFVSMKLEDTEMNKYNTLIKGLNKLIKDNPSAYTNKQVESSDIYSKLKDIFVWLIWIMEEKHIFGSKEFEDDGL